MLKTKLETNFEWFQNGSEITVEGGDGDSYFIKITKPRYINPNGHPKLDIDADQIWTAPRSVLSKQDQTLADVLGDPNALKDTPEQQEQLDKTFELISKMNSN
jgi:hypothetical protein